MLKERRRWCQVERILQRRKVAEFLLFLQVQSAKHTADIVSGRTQDQEPERAGERRLRSNAGLKVPRRNWIRRDCGAQESGRYLRAPFLRVLRFLCNQELQDRKQPRRIWLPVIRLQELAHFLFVLERFLAARFEALDMKRGGIQNLMAAR